MARRGHGHQIFNHRHGLEAPSTGQVLTRLHSQAQTRL